MERKADHKIDSMFTERWSPRSFTGEPITKEQLFQLLEAGRWAPSAYNEQPWRIIYALRDTPAWEKLFDIMVEFNKGWAKDCAALLLVISKNNFAKNSKPSVTHSFDCGSFWVSVAFQARKMGLYAHGMSGFDYDKARKVFNIPEGYSVEAMFAVGKGDKEKMQTEQDQMNMGRKKIEEFSGEGIFKA